MLKIVITGPESTGKSTLAKELAKYYKTTFVEEYARIFLTNLGRPYVQQDLLEIAKRQIAQEDSATNKNPKLLICDTSLEVIKIWSEYKYQSVDVFITNSLKVRKPDLYLLMRPDLLWELDPLRENPDNRDELYKLYKNELMLSKVLFYEISGNRKQRFELAKEAIEKNYNHQGKKAQNH